MRKIITITFLLVLSSIGFSQKHELGISLGAPNLIADIGKTNFIQPLPSPLSFDKLAYSAGILYRYNLNPRQSLRFNLNFNHVRFDDRQAREDYRTARGKHGRNDIIEASLLFEYNFFDINDEVKLAGSPYIFAGVGAFMAKDRLYNLAHTSNVDANGNAIAPTSDTDFTTTVTYNEELKSGLAIPFGIGYKVKFNYNWTVSAEIGVRFTSSDRLDYSFSQSDQYTTSIADDLSGSSFNITQEALNRNANYISSNQTGSVTSTDWYVVTGLNLTYAFGRPPCACE